MKKYIYVNEKGESIELGAFTPFLVGKIEGVSEVDNLISTTKGIYQDGSSVSNKTLDVRHISIEGAIDASTKEEIEILRRDLIKVFNAKFSGVFTRIYKGVTRKINCEIENIKFANIGIRSQRFLINLTCHNPYWEDIEESKEMKQFINSFKFPLIFPMQFGREGSEISIVNEGDISTPIHITMKGLAVNPSIINKTTGEFIKINRTLRKVDVLSINTEFGNKIIELNGKNIYPDMTLDSTLFELEVGENILSYETDSGGKDAQIEITYKNKYIGI